MDARLDFAQDSDYQQLVTEYHISLARCLSALERLRAAEAQLQDAASDNEDFGSTTEFKSVAEGSTVRYDGLDLSELQELSRRELNVFLLIGQGIATHEIAKKLDVAVSTVETYRERLKKKLKLGTGAALTRLAILWAVKNSDGVPSMLDQGINA